MDRNRCLSHHTATTDRMSPTSVTERERMQNPVVHFEIIGKEPKKLRSYYGDLFGWVFDTSGPVSPAVSRPGDYGFVDHDAANEGVGIPGGVGGGPGYDARVLFYVGVPDVEEALRKAESLGGKRQMGPDRAPGSGLTVGHFTDPEGHLIGVAASG
jgi:predicted enzyme related to lactoylglutathione lyase